MEFKRIKSDYFNYNGYLNNNKNEIDKERVDQMLQKFREELTEKLTRDLDDLFDAFVSDVEQISHSDSIQNGSLSLSSAINRKKKERGELPDKVFVARRSMLTELLEISHIKSIYHIFIAILIIFSLNTVIMDIIEKGSVGLDFELIRWGLGGFPKVVTLWLCMQLSTLVVVYPVFYYWSLLRPEGPVGWRDIVALIVYFLYQCLFLVLPVRYIFEHDLPSASAMICTTEQVRLLMKTHAFVRENIPKVLAYREEDNKDHPRSDVCPDFSKYLYFLFAPTLVYRDSYPRTPVLRWSYVVSNFIQVLGCILYTYYIFERFCVPVFRNFNREHVTAKPLIVSMFSCMLPGTLVLLIGFFAILHSWFNAFAEMLRFADRMFYKDWWNSTSFANYYRTWNIVVHDWLYTYVYKDFHMLLGPKYRGFSMGLVFLISAVTHEYIIVMALKFFYPVLFVMFMGAGFAFMFVKGSSRGWNIFLWLGLFMGMGLLMCLYSMEWFARQNCPENHDGLLDYLIPRSWTCNFDALISDQKN